MQQKQQVQQEESLVEKHEAMYALHDRAHCLAPGLFRSLQKGKRNSRLEVTYTYGKELIEFRGPYLLGVDDMRVLQGIIALAGAKGLELTKAPSTDEGRLLRNLLDLHGGNELQSSLYLHTSYRKLARLIGYKSIDDTRTIRASVERLFTVSVFIEANGKRSGFRILSTYVSEDLKKGGNLYIALNPRIAAAMVGQHARIEMSEVLGLSSDPARLLHQRLSAFISPGEKKSVGVDKLVGYVWPVGQSEPKARALNKRKGKISSALIELQSVGWDIQGNHDLGYMIGRPKSKDSRSKRKTTHDNGAVVPRNRCRNATKTVPMTSLNHS
jgi:hypothetical protein